MYFFKTSSITSNDAFGYRCAISSANVNHTPRIDRKRAKCKLHSLIRLYHLQFAQLLMQQVVGGIRSLSRESYVDEEDCHRRMIDCLTN